MKVYKQSQQISKLSWTASDGTSGDIGKTYADEELIASGDFGAEGCLAGYDIFLDDSTKNLKSLAL